MRSPRYGIAVMAVIAGVAVVAGCASGDDASARSGDAASSSRATVDEGGGDGTTSSAPEETPAGTTGDTTPQAGTGLSGPSSTPPPRSAKELAEAPGLPPELPPPEPVDDDAGAAAATGLAAEPTCDADDPAVAVVALSWQPAGSGGDQLVMVSTRDNGFETGTYATSGRLPADRASYELRDSQPGGVYYWRVATDVGGRWVASDVATFTGPTCAPF